MLKKIAFTEYLDTLILKRREHYKLKKQAKLKNTAPTIIGNNCVCGIIYKDLNLQYASPTTSILIPPEDFFLFAENLEYYLSCTLEETSLEGVSHPVGLLKNGDEQVCLIFMHDKSFQEAKEKWIRRCSRIDMNNLYIVFQYLFLKQKLFLRKKSTLYKRFKALPCANKRLLINAWFSFDKEIVAIPKVIFSKEKNTLLYLTKFSKKRLMDKFDYVSFLNTK